MNRSGRRAPVPLHRHQLAHLAPAAWNRLQHDAPDADARDCIAHWAAHALPVVVTRQPVAGDDAFVGAGIAAPPRWDRRRIALRVARAEVMWFDEFPRVDRVAGLLPAAARAPWKRLVGTLAALGATTRVYGSYGWQCITGLDHVRPGSDLDLWAAVDDDAHADAVAAALLRAPAPLPRLDGELHFPDGTAVSWREWLAWRTGATRAVLVRGLDASHLRWSSAAAGWREAA